jgi:hypothetical protein
MRLTWYQPAQTVETSPDPDIHKQILRELAFNKSCSAPYIVKYYGAFLQEVFSYIFSLPSSSLYSLCLTMFALGRHRDRSV